MAIAMESIIKKKRIMENLNPPNIEYLKAKKRVKEIKAFYLNLTCYCLIIPLLIVINLTYTPHFYWFFFSMAGWGLGLLFHGMAAFNFMPFLSRDWEDRKLREFMEEERRRQEMYTRGSKGHEGNKI